ncbi:putative multidrug resistance protein MdtD [Metallosphaera sp. J1]|uniref:MFS transporter n=1 Tax=Metallosphaera javensis (ex Hofmann et al. 2022) TaxID=99938 RepID=UPI001EDFD004|nr:MFS transporter [Metallosphaera javensis (ex Hofmann et al. 2022)]MCG3109622.1 putative multidrug resistance protein MdtD [Metallosphaera javensis (ex Hofmann et al. 2022)]
MDKKAQETLIILISVSLLINYVETMVVPAVPKIQQDFGTTETLVAWVTSAFTIVGAVVSPVFGKLGDLYGKRRVYLLSMVFYTFAVVMAGFSPNIYFLIAARAIQGLGFAMFPLSLAIITDILPPEMIATAQGIISGTMGIGTALGLVVGAFIDQDLGWQYAFHIAFIISLILLFAAIKLVPETGVRKKAVIDYVGFGTLTAGVTLILIYLTQESSWGWFSIQSLSLLVPGIAFLGFFGWYEQRVKNPVIELRLLKIRNVMVANVAGLISGIMILALFYGIIYYTQLPHPFGLDLDIISAGLTLAPSTLVMFVVGPLLGRMINRVGPKPIIASGSLVMMLGFYLLIVNRATPLDVTLDTVVGMVGLLCLMIPIVNMISVSLPPEDRGVGIGMNTLIRNIGSAVGPVITTSIMSSYQGAFVLPFDGTYMVEILPNSTAFNLIFTVGIGMAILNLLIAMTVKNYRFQAKPMKEVVAEAK